MREILAIYFAIASVHLICTLCYMVLGGTINKINGFWDWLVYSVFWIVQPINAIYRYICK